jgi:hypothetical protein
MIVWDHLWAVQKSRSYMGPKWSDRNLHACHCNRKDNSSELCGRSSCSTVTLGWHGNIFRATRGFIQIFVSSPPSKWEDVTGSFVSYCTLTNACKLIQITLCDQRYSCERSNYDLGRWAQLWALQILRGAGSERARHQLLALQPFGGVRAHRGKAFLGGQGVKHTAALPFLRNSGICYFLCKVLTYIYT